MTTTDMPNVSDTATITPAVPSFDAIAEKMAAMKAEVQSQRNQLPVTKPTATGSPEEAEVQEPVAPTPEDSHNQNEEYTDSDESVDSTPEQVSADNQDNSTADDLIDFIEFAESNPNAKFKFMRNGQEIVVDAKKAASILGQGSAIHEEARQLKIQRSEFDEYLNEQRAKQEGLTLAMEFTVQPQLQHAYDEIVKTQNYQTTFQQQLAQTNDPGQQARIRANMDQNERYIQQQSSVINQLKPQIDHFYQIRQQQVAEVLDKNRRAFSDKELKNEYVYKEIRDKVARGWKDAERQLVPGIKNIDLISSDEHILSLIRDGLKFRDKPRTQNAGSSLAALTKRTTSSGSNNRGSSDENTVTKLREQARAGDKTAGDNLLVMQLSRLRAQRGGR